MLDELKSILSLLESSELFKSWQQKHKDSFLSSCFIVDEQGWQLAFYSPKKNKISTFLKDRLIQSDSAIFKLDKERVKQLNIDEVKVDKQQVLDIAEKEFNEKQPGTRAVKNIIVLQHVDKLMWNITYLTSSLFIFNVKIDAISGSIISNETISTIMPGEKGKKISN